MDSTENNFSTETAPENLEAEVSSLRQQVWTLLVFLLVVSGTLSIFLMRQYTYARNDLGALKAQSAPFMLEFQKQEPGMNEFVEKLGEYSRTHPDFVPILNKYGVTITTAPGSAPKK